MQKRNRPSARVLSGEVCRGRGRARAARDGRGGRRADDGRGVGGSGQAGHLEAGVDGLAVLTLGAGGAGRDGALVGALVGREAGDGRGQHGGRLAARALRAVVGPDGRARRVGRHERAAALARRHGRGRGGGGGGQAGQRRAPPPLAAPDDGKAHGDGDGDGAADGDADLAAEREAARRRGRGGGRRRRGDGRRDVDRRRGEEAAGEREGRGGGRPLLAAGLEGREDWSGRERRAASGAGGGGDSGLTVGHEALVAQRQTVLARLEVVGRPVVVTVAVRAGRGPAVLERGGEVTAGVGRHARRVAEAGGAVRIAEQAPGGGGAEVV